MPDAIQRTVTVTGTTDVDKLIKLDVATHQNGGNVGYTDVGTKPDKKLDDKITVQGIGGIVSKISTSVNSKGAEATVAADLGNAGAKKPIGLILPEDNWQFKPYLLSDIVDKISTVDVRLKGYDLYVESYSFSGKTIDCLNDLAGLIFGYVNYDSNTDTYEIIGGDVTKQTALSGLTIDITHDALQSYELIEEKNSELSLFGRELISAAKEIAQIRAAIVDMEKDSSNADENTHELMDSLSFDFGTKNGFKPIGPELEVESVEWDYWYLDVLGEKYVNPVGDLKFVSKVYRYFKVDTISDLEASVDPDGTPTTVTRAYQRGLRTLRDATLWYRLKNFTSINGIYGRGYTINLTSLGLPSVTDYNRTKNATGEDRLYDDCYHVLYGIKSREIKVKAGETSSQMYTEYVPYMSFNMTPFLYGAAYQAKKTQKMSSGDTTDPTDIEIGELLTQFHYGATVELFSTSNTSALKYKGVLDAHNRLVSDSGQVMLVLITSETLGGEYFYGPLEGMDMSFITNKKKPLNPDPPDPDVYVISSALLDDYFDESTIDASLLSAWNDLVKLCQAQTPIGKYASATAGYPRFISEYVANPKEGQTPAVIGAVTSLTSSILNSDREVTIAMSLQEYTTANKKRRQLERKLKCLESKIALIVKCIKKNDPNSTISPSTIRSVLKTIITYNVILARVKNEAIATMIRLKDDYEKALNDALMLFNSSELASLYKAVVSVLLPDVLPSIGSSFRLPSVINEKTYNVTAVTVSGVTATITGECNG